jgi:hypothetical protein
VSLCKLIISFEVAVRLTDVGSGPAGRGGGGEGVTVHAQSQCEENWAGR